jgi:hypothetical protein
MLFPRSAIILICIWVCVCVTGTVAIANAPSTDDDAGEKRLQRPRVLRFDKRIWLATAIDSDVVLLDLQVIENTLTECWTKPTGLFVFNDEACHLSWRYMVAHAEINGVESVEPLSPERADEFRLDMTGAVRVHLKSGFQALWRSCSFLDAHYNYLNELIAYHVDRLLHVHRVPPVIVRRIDYRTLSGLVEKDADTSGRLQQMHMHCHHNRHDMTGIMIGWTRYQLKPITTAALDAWFAEAEFDVRKPTQRLMEFSKLAVELIMFDLPERLTHGPVLEMFVPHGSDTFTGNYFYVAVENERASWDVPYEQIAPAAPVCGRAAKSAKFRCAVAWPEATAAPTRHSRARLRGILTSFLASACIFPRTVAERLLHFGSLNSSAVISLTREVRKSLTEELEASSTDDYTLPSMHSLDARLRHVFQTLVQCVKVFGAANVILSEEIDSVVDQPPRVHVDPTGHRFVYNEQSGRWMRNDSAPVIDLNRVKLFGVARDELTSRRKLGLLHPTEQEFAQLAALQPGQVGKGAALQFSAAVTSAPVSPSALEDYNALFG